MDIFEFLSNPDNQHWVFWTLVIVGMVTIVSITTRGVTKE